MGKGVGGSRSSGTKAERDLQCHLPHVAYNWQRHLSLGGLLKPYGQFVAQLWSPIAALHHRLNLGKETQESCQTKTAAIQRQHGNAVQPVNA